MYSIIGTHLFGGVYLELDHGQNANQNTTAQKLKYKELTKHGSNLNLKMNSFEICQAASDVLSSRNVDGAQLVKGVWLIYLKTNASRAELLCQGFTIRGTNFNLYDSNPYQRVRDETPVEKILIKDIPLNIDNKVIEEYLKSQEGLVLKSDVKYGKAKDSSGNWSNYKNGDRFVYALAPILPALGRYGTLDGIPFRVFHESQEDICKSCNMPGHKVGEVDCPALNTEGNVIGFRSFMNVLSNDYPCSMKYMNEEFKSLEHAYQWAKAMELGKLNLAEQIKSAIHAGAARAKARENIDENETAEWERKSKDVMMNLLCIKAKMVGEFKVTLLETRDKIIAEATKHTFWASGLPDIKTTEMTKIEYWPGKNHLGNMMMDLRAQLFADVTDQTDDNENEQTTHDDEASENMTDAQVDESLVHSLTDDLETQGTYIETRPDTQNESIILTETQTDDTVVKTMTEATIDQAENLSDDMSVTQTNAVPTNTQTQTQNTEKSFLKSVKSSFGSKVGSVFKTSTTNTIEQFLIRKRKASKTPPKEKTYKQAKENMTFSDSPTSVTSSPDHSSPSLLVKPMTSLMEELDTNHPPI